MAIVFGWYSFAQKVFSPKELNMESEETKGITFEIRQKCAHLMYVPVFPTGKMYVFRKQGQLYQAPDQVMQLMKARVQPKTPWYCFALPILVVAYFTLTGIRDLWSGHEYNNYKAEEYNFRKERIERALKVLDTNFYIEIKKREDVEYFSSYSLFLKVIGRNAETIKYVVLQPEKYDPLPFEVRDYLLAHRDSLDTLTQPIQNFKKAMAQDIDEYESGEGAGCAFTRTKDLYKIADVAYVNGPDIRNRGTGGYGGGSFYLEFLNYGEPAELIEIKNVEGDLKWTNQLPMHIETSSSELDGFALKGEGSLRFEDYKFILVVKDTMQRTHQFLVQGNEMKRWVSRL